MIEIIPNWHPVFVHFPIAFATAALAFISAAMLFKQRSWTAQCLISGRWMLWAAAIFACVAAGFGWFAYNSVEHDEAGHLAMTLHRNWALAAVAVLVLLAMLDVRLWRSNLKPSYGFLILLVVAWSLVASTAWHGGEVVYRHGLGVMSLPEAEGPGHPHEHGADHDHGDMPSPIEGSLQQERAHDDTAQAAQSHAAEPSSNAPAVHVPVSAPHKAGHTHAPGTPPHKD